GYGEEMRAATLSVAARAFRSVGGRRPLRDEVGVRVDELLGGILDSGAFLNLEHHAGQDRGIDLGAAEDLVGEGRILLQAEAGPGGNLLSLSESAQRILKPLDVVLRPHDVGCPGGDHDWLV